MQKWQLDDAERFREHLDNEADAVHWVRVTFESKLIVSSGMLRQLDIRE